MSISGVIAGAITLYFTGGNYAAAAAAYSLAAGVEALVLAPTNRTHGPTLSDLQNQISSYGAAIPIIRGRFRLPGNIIWATEKVPTDHTTSSGKGSSSTVATTTTYSSSFAIAFCEGVCSGYARIWIDKTLRLAIGPGADAATIIASTGLAKSIRFYPGDQTQLPDPLIESYEGIGNTSAFRGTCYMVFEAFQLTEFGNRIPVIEVEIIEAGIPTVERHTVCSLYPDDYGNGHGNSWVTDRKIYWWRNQSSSDSQLAIFLSVDGQEKQLVAQVVAPAGGILPSHIYRAVNTRDRFLMHAIVLTGDIVRPAQRCNFYDLVNTPTVEDNGIRHVDLRQYFDTYDYLEGCNYSVAAFDQDTEVIAISGRSLNARYYAERISVFSAGHDVSIADVSGNIIQVGEVGSALKGEYVIRPIGVNSQTVLCALALAVNRIFALLYNSVDGKMHLLILDQSEASLISDFPGPSVQPDYGTDIQESIRTDGSTVWAWCGSSGGVAWKWRADGSFEVLSTDANGRGDDGTFRDLLGGPMAYIDDTHLIMNGEVLANNDSASPIYRHQMVQWNALAAGTVPLSTIVDDLCGPRVSSITTELTDQVDAFVVSKQMTRATALGYLAAIYQFDGQPNEASLYFKKRGGAPVCTIDIDELAAHDFGADAPDAMPLARAKELDLASGVVVNFTDLGNDYQPGSVPSEQINTSSNQSTTLDATAVGMTGHQAAKLADIAKQMIRVGRMTAPKIWTTYKYKRLQAADVIQVDAHDIVYLLRIKRVTDQSGLLQIEAVFEDRYIYDSAARGTGKTSSTALITPPAAVNLTLLDIPILRDADNDAGFYARLTPAGGRYQGGSVYQRNGDVLSLEGSVAQTSPVGSVAGVLADPSGPLGIFDEASSIDVVISSAQAPSVSSVTREQALAGYGAWLIGDEIIVARNQVLVGTVGTSRRYRLSGLLRALRGTSATGHALSDRAVALALPGTLRINHGAADIGVSRTYVGIGTGRNSDSGDVRTITNNAIGLRPFPPVQLGAGVNVGRDVTFQWRRQTRLAAPLRDGVIAALGETVEQYLVEISASSTFATIVRSLVTTTSTAVYANGLRYVDEQAGLPSPFYWRVAQYSSVFGYGARSIPMAATFPAATAGALTYSRNWNDNLITSQTLFGTSASQSINSTFSYVMSRGTGAGQVKSRFNAVPNFVNGSIEFDVQVPAAGSYASAGVVFRTTNWDNGTDTNAYIVAVNNSNALELGRGTNTSSGAYTQLINIGGAVTAGSVVHLLVNFNGKSIQVYLGGVKRIDTTDNAFLGAGQVAFSEYGANGVSSTFDNLVITYTP